MKEIIRSVRPQVTLEVGCAYGVSSRYICEALQEVSAVKHIAMDPYQYSEFEGIGLANLKRAGCLDIVGSILLLSTEIIYSITYSLISFSSTNF